jgi:hypothetical protein
MPSVNQVVDSYLIQTTLTDGVSAPAESVASSLDQVASAAIAAGQRLLDSSQATAQAGQRISQTSQAWDAITRKNDDVSAAAYRLSQALAALTRAQGLASAQMAAGTANMDQISRTLTAMITNVVNASDAYHDLVASADEVSHAMSAQSLVVMKNVDDMVDVVEAVENATAAQAEYNRILGVKPPTSQEDYKARAADVASFATQLDNLRAKYDPLYAASQKYAQQLAEYNTLIANEGLPNAEAEAKALDLINQQFAASIAPVKKAQEAQDAYGGSIKANAVAFRLLGVQAVQGISGIATGQDVFTVLIQQGHQIVDVMLATDTSFSQLAASAKTAFTAIGGFTTLGVAAVFAAIGAAVYVAVSRMSDLSKEIREMGNAAQAMGTAAAQSGTQIGTLVTAIEHLGIATKDAQAVGNAMAQTGTGSFFDAKHWADFVATINAAGGSVSEMAKALDQASQGNESAYSKLNNTLNLLNGTQLTNIHNLLEQGRTTEAFAILTDQLGGRMQNQAEKSMSAWGRFFQSMSNGLDAIATGFGKALEAAGQFNEGAGSVVVTMPGPKPAPGQAAPGTTTAPGAPGSTTYGPTLPPPQTAEQAALTAKSNQDVQEQNRILGAAITQRERLKATIDAQNEATKNGLIGDDAAAFVKQRLGLQVQKEATAFGDELTAMKASDQVGVSMARAVDQGTASMLRAQAAAEAHAEAVTKAGVSEKALTAEILNRNAAQALQKGAQDTSALQQEEAYAKTLADASKLGSSASYGAEQAVAIDKATQALREQRDVATDPAIVKALNDRIFAINRLMSDTKQLTDDTKNNNAANANEDAIRVLKLQGALLGDNSDAAAALVAEYQKLLELEHNEGALPEALTESQKRVLATTGALAAQNNELQRQQGVMNDLANTATQAFDQVGQAIVQAFVQGNGAAVNWGNVMKSVIASVIQEFAKLAILNPILNELFGGGRATLSDLGSLGGGQNAAANAVGGQGTLSSLMSLGSGAGTLNSLSGGSLFGSLGITGPGGLTQSLGLTGITDAIKTGFSSVTSGISGFLGTGITGGTIQAGEAGAVGDLAPGLTGSTLAGSTIGSSLAGAAAGFAGGTMLGNLLAGATGKASGPNPMIGAGAGTLAGLAVGAAFAPATLGLSMLIGGLIGGAGGGLIGPKPASPFSSTYVGLTSGGQLSLGATSSQMDPNAAAERDAAQKGVDAVNQTMAALGISLKSLGDNVDGAGRHLAVAAGDIQSMQIGINSPNGPQDPSKVADLASQFQNFRFQSSDPHIQAFLTAQAQGNGGAWPDLQTLATTLATVKQFASDMASTDFADKIDSTLTMFGQLAGTDLQNQLGAVETFVLQTVPAFKALGTVTGSYYDQINQITATFAPAIAMAQQLGYAEQDLTDKRDELIQETIKAARAAADVQAQTTLGKAYTAESQLSGDPNQALNTNLYNFDLQADAQRKQLADQYKGIYGDAYASTYEFVENSQALERELGDERLLIQKQANEAMVQNARAATAASTDLWSRMFTAQSSISRDPYQAEGTQLYQFDTKAQQERDTYSDQMKQWFGDAVTSTAYYAEQMTQLDTTLAYERYAIQLNFARQMQQAYATAAQNDLTVMGRYYTAKAANDNNAQEAYQAQLYNFDIQAQAQRSNLSNTLMSTFGDAFAQTAEYAREMADLDLALGQERLQITQNYNDQTLAKTEQAAGQALSIISQISQYAASLQTGSLSPLSPQAQYALASQQFAATSAAASQGDVTALQNLTAQANTFLTAAQVMYGSGQKYVDAYNQVLAALSSVSKQNPDVLTASVLQQETRTQTQQLVDQLVILQQQVQALQDQLRQNTNIPARLAA